MNRIKLPLIAASLMLAPAAAHAESVSPRQIPQIHVTGEGVTALKPDMAILTLTVMREAETARAALDSNNKAMAGVMSAMTSAGIAERDLQTSNFNINPRYVYPKNNDGSTPPRIVAYQVSNTLTVRIRDLSSVGGILDKSVTLGVNQGGQVVFTNDDPSAAITEARGKAMADAINRARTLTRAAGIGLGRVVEITEQSFRPGPVPLAKSRTMAMEASDEVPMSGGENDYRVNVSVSFELEQ